MLCMCVTLASGWLALTRLIMVEVPADRVEIAVESVTEESVKISLKAEDGKKISRCSYQITADGKCCIILERGILPVQNGGGENWESTLDLSRTGRLETGENVHVTEIYLGAGRDSVLIWKESAGQD